MMEKRMSGFRNALLGLIAATAISTSASAQHGRNPTVLFIYPDGRTIVQQVNPQASDVAVSHAKGSGDRKHTGKAHATREAARLW
jgi:hypothetical protein